MESHALIFLFLAAKAKEADAGALKSVDRKSQPLSIYFRTDGLNNEPHK
jgi:hypothetical protein